MIDTSSNEVIRLLAIHFVNESFANEVHLELMESVENDLIVSDYSSPYFDSFQDQLSFFEISKWQNRNRKIMVEMVWDFVACSVCCVRMDRIQESKKK